MNWGKSLILAFLLFGAFIIYIAYVSMTTQVDLVSKDYYKEELEYQKVIDSKANARELKKQIAMEVKDKTIKIKLPEELRSTETSGRVRFYSVVNAQHDKNFDLSFDQNGEQLISTESFAPGNYTAKISYSNSGRDFYTEIPVTL